MSAQFNQVGVVYRNENDATLKALQRLKSFLSARKINFNESAITSQPCANNLRVEDTSAMGGADLIIVLGGDGSMLAAARAFAAQEIPLLGINLGRLGFLTDIPLNEMEPVLDEIFAGNLREERRLLLQMDILRNGDLIAKEVAFNDVVLHKWESLRMVEFETFVDDHLVHRQRADGMIVSTPTGSTAYALSTGGPIADPAMEAILLVPISPHAMTGRPMVVPGSSRIEIKLMVPAIDTRVSYDGQGNLKLSGADVLRITASPHKARLIHPADYDYFELLRTKLHWGK
ncbi:MAG: NAD(+) kinase [Gammaproteobacteria bacterium]|nr:MAG: NAD(+) kinase [Gammaproteobacteria bacterium]RLA11429.1 MAG: NAD(+) kinase [Gammaproteobacteria bacterium]